MNKCQRCDSKRVLSFSAHCSDCFSCHLDGIDYEGYVPDLDFGGGDDVYMTVCLDCGQVQGKFPHRKIPEVEPDIDDITCEDMLHLCEDDCDSCQELKTELELNPTSSKEFRKWWWNHQRKHEQGMY